MTFTNATTKKDWEQILIPEMISSDESGVEADDQEVIIVSSLPWRSNEVQNMLIFLDDKIHQSKSPLALCQTKKRVVSDVPSNWPIPPLFVPSMGTQQVVKIRYIILYE